MTQFNPYHEWLALDPQTTSFNYYRLLGLEDLEQDPEAIHTALEQTLQRVRACDPGAHAKRWASLIEEIEQAGKCLTDEWDKGDYDRQLDLSFRPQSQSGLSIEQPPAKKAAPAPQHVVTSKFKLAPEATTLQASMLPPRMGGAAATTGATQPDAQTANATKNNRSTAVDAHVPPGTPDNRVKSDADQPADSGGYQVPSTAFVEAASDTDVPAVVDPGDHNLANTGGTPSPTPDTIGAHPVSTNGLAAAEDAVDAAPASNPMSAYRFPVNPQPDDPSDPAQSGELSEGDIPLATAIPSTELNSAPLAQPISGPDWPQTPVEPPMRPPPAPQPRRRSTLTRNTKLGIGTALVLVVAIVSFAWFSQNTAERSATVSQLPADRGQGAETTAGPNPEATDPEATDPEATDPEASDPEASDPEASDPEASDPEPTEPEPSDPEPTDPEPTDPKPTDPEPTDPKPTDPKPTDPKPTDPKPTDPEPTDPEPTDPEPTPDTSRPPESGSGTKPTPPTQRELADLGQALQMARAALGKGGVQNPARTAAKKHLKRAATLAKLPQHKDLVRRLDLLARYVDQFWVTLDRVLRGFEGGEELQYKDSIILVRERPTDELKIRYKGLNLSHRLTQLPPGIVNAIANHGFDESQPVSQILKGAFLVVNPTASESMISEARRGWEEAAKAGVEIGDLPKVIDDDYQLEPSGQDE